MKVKIMKPWFSKLMNDYLAITLYPFGIYTQVNPSQVTIRHELIHWEQQKEMLCIFFYVWYFVEWVVKLFIYGKYSYYHISFEKEAYSNDNNKNYLTNRKCFAWLKYLL
jgi:hypothetical protein